MKSWKALLLGGWLFWFLFFLGSVQATHIVAEITYTPNTDVTINKPLSFVPLQSGGTSPYTCNWDFGDGETTSICSPTKTYTRAGQYTITLSGTDVTAHAYSTTKILDVGTGTYTGPGTTGGTTPSGDSSTETGQPSPLPVVGSSTAILVIGGLGAYYFLGRGRRGRIG